MNTRRSFFKKTAGIAGAITFPEFIHTLFASEAKKEKQAENSADRVSPTEKGILVRKGWNVYSMKFISAPIFDVHPFPSAFSYTAFISHHLDFRSPLKVSSKEPNLNLSEIWNKMAQGTSYQVRIQAIDANKEILASLPTFYFHKSFPFTGSPYEAKTQYMDSSNKAFDYLINFLEPVAKAEDSNLVEAVEKTLTTFKFLHYPALLVSIYVDAMLKYAQYLTDSSKISLTKKIASRLGDYLLATRTPQDYVYAFMPISHVKLQFEKNEKYSDLKNPFLQVPRSCQVGNIFLDLYESTNEKKFLDAAVQIGGTLKKNQKPDGSFYFRVDALTGNVVDEKTSDQVNPMLLLDRLVDKHNMTEFTETRDKVLHWIFENPVKSFLWQSQYEDVVDFPDYQNLEFFDIHLFVDYLQKNSQSHPEYIALAKKLFDFVEDQFVMWENSFDSNFITPSVCEQYRCYKPIDAHSGAFIKMCVDLYAMTKENIYIDKAKAIANTLTQVQHPEGYYPTWLIHPTGVSSHYGEIGEISYERFWPNCTAMAAMGMLELGLKIK